MTSNSNAAEQVRRGMELLWGAGPRPGRGPKPALSVERIVAAAITVADRDGIGALSMRGVAAELGVGTMSLYRHVPSKAELMALMLDRVCEPGDALNTPASKDWRAKLERSARGSYQLYLDHPWLIDVNWSRPLLGPNSLAGVELFMRALDGLGLSDQERIAVMMAIDSYVVGQARQRIHYSALQAETGLSDEEFWKLQEPLLTKAMLSGAYPSMAALGEDAFDMDWEEAFAFGLARLLDGLTVLVGSRQPTPPL